MAGKPFVSAPILSAHSKNLPLYQKNKTLELLGA
jgi:hypothetical protein